MPQVISACCVLHNIVEQFKDNYHTSWTMEVNEGNICMLNLFNVNYHNKQ